MPLSKELSRIEAKLDAILEAHDLKPTDYADPISTAGRPARRLTKLEQEAIDNAPKTPTAEELNPPTTRQRVDAKTNAPDTSSSVPRVPADAGGSVTVETKEPDGDVTVETKPAEEVRRRR